MFLQVQWNCQLSIIQGSCEGILADDGSDTGFVSKILRFLFLFLLPTKVDEQPGNKQIFLKSCKSVSNLGERIIQPEIYFLKR